MRGTEWLAVAGSSARPRRPGCLQDEGGHDAACQLVSSVVETVAWRLNGTRVAFIGGVGPTKGSPPASRARLSILPSPPRGREAMKMVALSVSSLLWRNAATRPTQLEAKAPDHSSRGPWS